MHKQVIRRQSPVRGGRVPLPACVIRKVWNEVSREARKHGVSRSWVIAVRLAVSFGLDVGTDDNELEDYILADQRRRNR